MNYHTTPTRPGATAIAALLALTATPALAQAIVTDPLGAQAPPAAGPPAPEGAAPAPSAPDQAVQAQPSPAQASSSPKLPDLPVAAVKAPQPAASVASRKAEPAAAKAAPAMPPASKRWTVTPAPPAASPAASDAPTLAAQSDLLTPAPVAEPAKPAADAAPAPGPTSIWLPLAGGLLLAGGGAAFAMKRRRKPGAQLRPADIASPQPAPVPAPVRAPVAANTGIAPPTITDGHQAMLEALVAQPPSPENPFHTRKLRLRRAHHLLRTGQVPAAAPGAPAPRVATAQSATDRWSEMRVAGQSPVQLSWQPVRG